MKHICVIVELILIASLCHARTLVPARHDLALSVNVGSGMVNLYLTYIEDRTTPEYLSLEIIQHGTYAGENTDANRIMVRLNFDQVTDLLSGLMFGLGNLSLEARSATSHVVRFGLGHASLQGIRRMAHYKAKANAEELREVALFVLKDTKALPDEYNKQIFRLISLLGSDVEYIPLLITILEDSNNDSGLRHSATIALMGFGAEASIATPALIRVAKVTQNEMLLRQAAIYALGKIGSSTAVPLLTEMLQDGQWPIRQGAATALGLIGPTAVSAIPALKDLLKDTEAVVRASAAAALERIKPDHP
jgi:hypothetical protein